MQSDMGLAYFYFDTNDMSKQTSRSLLLSLVLSLTAKSKNYSLIEGLYEKHDKLYNPTEKELFDLLVKLLQCFKQTYIVIDALDECDDYHQVLDEVVKAIHEWQLSCLHLLVSSRREQNIVETMEQCSIEEIYLSAELVSSDIVSYIHSAFGKDHHLKRWNPRVQEYIKEVLISGANGMYVCL